VTAPAAPPGEEPGGSGIAPSADAYAAFADRIVESGLVRDPWVDGKPRFSRAPVVVGAGRYAELCRAAEAVAEACNAAAGLLAEDRDLAGDVLGLTPYQRLMWEASSPSWHGIARADVFVTDDGVAVAEINCDTPTGEAEAVVLGELCADGSTMDPNRGLRDRFLAMVDFMAARERLPERGRVRTVGLVYPTELTDDLPLVRLYKRWFESRGWGVVLGSPYNLSFESGRTCLFEVPLDVLFRHYKTDWWAERVSAWRDDPIADPAPLDGPLRAVLSGIAAGSLSVVNPFGAVAIQNKRVLSLLWEQIHRLPQGAQAAVERYVPLTRRLEVMHTEQLLAQRAQWVLKSDYGAEGEEVVIGRDVDDATWRLTLERAEPRKWVAQRYFSAETDASGANVNHGVFLIGGKAAGLYARVQVGATDASALSAAALVET
jgi:glutathionylspermidine synthase